METKFIELHFSPVSFWIPWLISNPSERTVDVLKKEVMCLLDVGS